MVQKTNGQPGGGGALSGSGSAHPTNHQPSEKNLCKKSFVNVHGTEIKDLRSFAIDILTSRGCQINENTIGIVVDRLQARKAEGERRRKGGIRRNFRRDDHEQLIREQRRNQEALLKEWGVTEQELKEWREQDEVSGREAAYDELCNEELCLKLTGEFARKSAKRTSRNIGEIRDRYETIVLQFLAVRYTQPDGKRYSLESVLRENYETDGKLKQFLEELGVWIELYVSRCIRQEPNYHWKLNGSDDVRAVETLRGHAVSEGLMAALSVEYVRDRGGLMRFLSMVFERWREINQPHSLLRQRLLTHQLAGTPKEKANALETIGAVPKCTTAEQSESLHARIKQYCSRDRKKALEKRQKAR